MEKIKRKIEGKIKIIKRKIKTKRKIKKIKIKRKIKTEERKRKIRFFSGKLCPGKIKKEKVIREQLNIDGIRIKKAEVMPSKVELFTTKRRNMFEP